jgi:stringent starvation protein B
LRTLSVGSLSSPFGLAHPGIENAMTSSRPYLIRALYDWITDNGLTPHILVDAGVPSVAVPQQFVHEGRIVLNINSTAVNNLQLSNDAVEFSARFSGTPYRIYIPSYAVMAIYARENGQGMAFGQEQGVEDEPPPAPGGKKPTLKVVK